MEIISSKHVVDIVCRTLGRVDRRLTGHGERVASLALQLLLTQKGGTLSRQEMDLVLAALFHDVGAYKTDEIDGLLSFEREGGWNHAVYGYLFLKNFSPLGAVADAVLYHHCPYRELRQIDPPPPDGRRPHLPVRPGGRAGAGGAKSGDPRPVGAGAGRSL